MMVWSWFCKHNWKIISSEVNSFDFKKMVSGTEYYLFPDFQIIKKLKILKICSCEKCGKLKTIKEEL